MAGSLWYTMYTWWRHLCRHGDNIEKGRKMGDIKWVGENLDNPAIISVDLGNNYLKVYAFLIEDNEMKKRQFSMPHGYVELSETAWVEAKKADKLSRGRAKLSHTFQIVTGGTAKQPQLKSVSIGASAFDSGNNKPLLGSNKYVRGGIDALLCAVLSEVFPKRKYPKGHNNLIVGYGFPSTEWQQTEDIEALIKKTHRIIDPNGGKRSFRVRASVAWDENVGGLVNAMSYKMNKRDPQTGQFVQQQFEAGDRVIMFDAGGWLGSMAWAHIDDDGFAVMDYGRDIVGIDGGAITVRQALRETMKLKFPELKGMRDKDFDDSDLDESLRTNQYVVSGDKDNPLDLREAIADSLGYIKTVRETYVNQFGGGRAAQHILMTGGTTNPLYDYLLETFNHKSVHLAGKRGEIYMANVRGGMVIIVDRLIADGLFPDPYQSALER